MARTYRFKILESILKEQIIVFIILVIHLTGFINMPQSSITGYQSNSHLENSIEKCAQYSWTPKNRKVVLVVIDAWREDHLSSDNSAMVYSRSLINSRHGQYYSIKTASPTVTMPRIKSMVSGSIPSFMDVVFNFASSEFVLDNFVVSAKEKGLKLAFFGDETWLKLFPGVFYKSEGTTSFFVSDYTEVDQNVSRHIPELFSSNNDWDFLILHYLGLDHIGHLEGPKSSLINPKLKEMDHVIQTIHRNLEKTGEPYLLFVTGDHGMSDIKGHGGDSPSEIWTPALVVSDKMKEISRDATRLLIKVANQIDIASTLALYSGIGVPRKNVGKPLSDVLSLLPGDERLSGHYRVSKQLMHLLIENEYRDQLGKVKPLYEKTLRIHLELWTNYDSKDPRTLNASFPFHGDRVTRLTNSYEELETLLSSMLTENMESYNFVVLLSTSIILFMISFPTIIWSLFLSTKANVSLLYDPLTFYGLIFGAFVILFLEILGVNFIGLEAYFIVFIALLSVFNIISFAKCFTSKIQLQISAKSVLEAAVIAGVILYPFSLLATSFVEEEHFSFYFYVSFMYFLFIATSVFYLFRHFEAHPSYGPKKSDIASIEKHVFTSDILPHDFLSYPSLYNVDYRLFTFLNGRSKECPIDSKSMRWRYVSQIVFFLISWILLRFLRSMNATGDKWKNIPHVNDFLKTLDSNIFVVIVIFSLFVALFVFKTYAFPLMILFYVFLFLRHYPVLSDGARAGVLEAQLCYWFLFILILYNTIKLTWRTIKLRNLYQYDRERGNTIVVAFLLQVTELALASLYLLIQRPENILATALSFLHMHVIIPLLVKNGSFFGLTNVHVSVITYWIAQAHFFIMGNSNSFSTVQINSGFVGMTSYWPVIHGFLIVWNTFGPKLIVLLHTLVVLVYQFDRRFLETLKTWWVLQLMTLTVYVINVTLQRHHLFIWSVFAPKLLYEECHFFCLLSLTFLVFIYYSIARFISSRSG